MMQKVPHIILEVKEHHAAQDPQEEAQECGCLTGQWGRCPPQPLGYCRRKDVHEMVVDGDTQGSPDVRPGDGSIRMEPVAVDAGPSGSQQVQSGVNANQEEVGEHREECREGRASQEVMVVLAEVVPKRL